MPITETFHGFIETTTDTLLVFEACRQGILPKINRRLQERERGAVKSGTVFVFDEKESGIKRWTDGLVWSPSRILGNFLIYRELDGRELIEDKTIPKYNEEYKTSDRERALVGSLTDTYKFKIGGLIKKTLSIQVNGSSHHLISYYTKEDVLDGKLISPSTIPDIASVRISPDLFMQQNFRIPLSLEYPDSYSKRLSLSSSPCSSNDSISPRRRSSALLLEMTQPYIDTPYYYRRRLSSSDLDSSCKNPSIKKPKKTSNNSSPQILPLQCSSYNFPMNSNSLPPTNNPFVPPPQDSWFNLPKNNLYYDNKRNYKETQVRSFTSFDSIDSISLFQDQNKPTNNY